MPKVSLRQLPPFSYGRANKTFWIEVDTMSDSFGVPRIQENWSNVQVHVLWKVYFKDLSKAFCEVQIKRSTTWTPRFCVVSQYIFRFFLPALFFNAVTLFWDESPLCCWLPYTSLKYSDYMKQGEITLCHWSLCDSCWLICLGHWIKAGAKPRLLSHRSIFLKFKLTGLHIFHIHVWHSWLI